MSDDQEPAPDLRANRRKEVFRAIRGSKLTGQRGTWSGESAHPAAAGARKIGGDDELASMRRVRLGGVIEDEADSTLAGDTRRYSEPND
jgi:hypothetical protein